MNAVVDTARIRRESEQEGPEEYITVRDLSIGGIGLWLDKDLPTNTVLLVEPLSRGPRTLLARVRHTTPENGGSRLHFPRA